MKIQLNVTNKTITTSDSVLIGDLYEILRVIVPEYSSALNSYTLKFGRVPNTNLITINKPIHTDYGYKPDYSWLNYNTGRSTIIDDKVSTNYAVSLNDGTYNIEIK